MEKLYKNSLFFIASIMTVIIIYSCSANEEPYSPIIDEEISIYSKIGHSATIDQYLALLGKEIDEQSFSLTNLNSSLKIWESNLSKLERDVYTLRDSILNIVNEQELDLEKVNVAITKVVDIIEILREDIDDIQAFKKEMLAHDIPIRISMLEQRHDDEKNAIKQLVSASAQITEDNKILWREQQRLSNLIDNILTGLALIVISTLVTFVLSKLRKKNNA